MIKLKIDLANVLAKFAGPGVMRKFNAAVRDGLSAKRASVEKEVKRRAPKGPSKELSRAVRVVVKGGAGGSVKFLTMFADIDPKSQARKYWMVREFGPRGGVIRGKPYLTFAFKGSPFFKSTVSAGEVHNNPTKYGYDYTMVQGELIFGIKRKTGLSWEQLYPNAKKRKPRSLRNGKGIPSNGNPNVVPLFVIVRSVEQSATPYIRPAFEEKQAMVMRSIERFVVKAFK